MAKTTTKTQRPAPRIKETKAILAQKIEGLTSQVEVLKSDKKELEEQPDKRITKLEETEEKLRKQHEQDEKSLRDKIESTKTSTAGLALAIVLISVWLLFLIASSHCRWPASIILISGALICIGSIISSFIGNWSGNDPEDAFFTSIICGIILGIAVSITTKSAYSHNHWFIYVIYTILSVALFFAITYASYKKTRKKFSYPTTILLSLIFLVISYAGIGPLSRYYNLNNIEHDKKIVENLQITNEPNGIEVLLPAAYASKHKYMKQVLCFKWPGQELIDAEEAQNWNKLSIKCSEGEAIWYKAKLDFPVPVRTSAIEASGTVFRDREHFPKKEIILFFNHAWQDYETTKQIPDPNGSSS